VQGVFASAVLAAFFVVLTALTPVLGRYVAGAFEVAIATIRGFTRDSAATLGNFWVDLTRAIFSVLVPLSIVGRALFRRAGTAAEF
jgi:K+-transporting ATPase A subunit